MNSSMVQKLRLHWALTAVGRFVRAVHAVVVAVTHPHPGDAALGDGTLELGGRTRHLSYRTERQVY